MSESTEDFAELIARMKSGDGAALAQLFSKHRERLWWTVHFRLDPRLTSRVDPDDVLQEAYLKAASRTQHFVYDTETSFYVWLRLIVGQTLVEVHRRHLGAKVRDAGREFSIQGFRFPQATSTSLAVQLVGDLTSPSEAAQREEISQQLAKALDEMDPIDREVLALRHFEELTNSEVAEVLGIQQKAASIRYVRALKRLKQALSRLPGFNLDDTEQDLFLRE